METLTITKFMAALGRDSLQGGVLVLAVLAAQWLLGDRLAPRWRSALWLLVMTRLLLVVSVGSVISVFNFLPHTEVKKSVMRMGAMAPALSSKPTDAAQPAPTPLVAVTAVPVSQFVADSSPQPSYGSLPMVTESSPTEVPPPRAAANRAATHFTWSRRLFFSWLAGAGGMAVYVLAGSVRVNRRIARMAPVRDPQLLALLADCEARLGIGRRLCVVEGAQMGTPALHGFFRPRLLLPLGFAGQFSPQELRFILLHELAHVQRQDILLNWLAAALQIAHWFNPVIWFGFARWRCDREQACDALALEAAGGNQSQAYGETILRLLENFTQRATVPGLVGILEDKKQLRQRIKMIASFRSGRKLGLLTAAMLALLGIVCLTDAQNNSHPTKIAAALPTVAVTNRLDQLAAEPRPVVTNAPAVESASRLKSSRVAGGRVYDENGAPQPGIKVRVLGGNFAENGSEFWRDLAGSNLPVTDSAGRWQLADFPADLQNVAIEFTRPDGSKEKFRNPPKAKDYPQGDPMDFEAFQSGKARFVLRSGHELHGTTVNSQGQPVPAVRIKIGYGSFILERAGEVQSDASGHFNLLHVNHRQAMLTAEAPGYAITSQIVDLQSNLPEVRLQLDKLSPLHMKVVNGNGRSIAGAKVATQEYQTEGQLLDFSGVTDSRGSLVWSNAPVSSFAIVATAPASSLCQKLILTPDQREITFHLRAGMDQEVIVLGKVTDAKTGAPVKLKFAGWRAGRGEEFDWEGAEISDSGFRMQLPATRFRSGQHPIYQLQLEAAGYGLLTTPWRGIDEGDWNASFKLQPAAAAGGTVSLPYYPDVPGGSNMPAAGAQLWTRLGTDGSKLIIAHPNWYSGDSMIRVEVDNDGKFVLPDVPDDQPVVFTHADGFLSTFMGELKSHPNVRLQPWGRVTGILKIAGKPSNGVSIILAALTWSPNCGYFLSYSTSTAPDGSFSFERVPAGEYKLYRSQTKPGPMAEDHQFPLVVNPGETANVDYSNPGRAVIGRALPDQAGMAVDWLKDNHTLALKQPPVDQPVLNYSDFATMQAAQKAYEDGYHSPERLQQAREARTYVLAFKSDGSFRAEDVPPGTYELNLKVTKPGKNLRFSSIPNPQNDLGSLTREVVVPAGDGPFDLGTFTMQIKPEPGS